MDDYWVYNIIVSIYMLVSIESMFKFKVDQTNVATIGLRTFDTQGSEGVKLHLEMLSAVSMARNNGIEVGTTGASYNDQEAQELIHGV